MPMRGPVDAILFDDVEYVGRTEGRDTIGIVFSADDKRIGVGLPSRSAAKLLVLLIDALRQNTKTAVEDRSLHEDAETGSQLSLVVESAEIYTPALKTGQFVLDVGVGDGLKIPFSMSPMVFEQLIAAAAVALHQFREAEEPLRN